MPRLSDPLSIKGFTLRNRFVMPPMVTGMAENYTPSEHQLAWYAERAGAGIGLVVAESTVVAPDAGLVANQLGAWDDSQIVGLGRLARTIHEHHVPAVLQIVHGGGRAWRATPDQPRIGASAVTLAPGPPPRPMRESEIADVIDLFTEAARRALAAGFEGVEVHAAHYYLLSQFLSPVTNQRTDRWGGDLAGRARLAVEVVRAVRRTIGREPLIFCRMHALENVEGGLSTEEIAAAARMLVDAGVDVIDASAIGQSAVASWVGGTYLQTSSATGELRRAVSVPVIAVGKLGEPGVAQRALDDGCADLVALGRQLIADPRAAEKILAGRDDEIGRCQQCFACFASIRTGPVRCSVNKNIPGSRPA